ncbi:MAG: preprotein translocase subunit SecG [Kiritimatiellae bacterium]|jgi:preprotein translocase subunit SecG|nr:preprotein translocase subunit SecG [Kiritimatiellia bacterium]MDD3441347.1 preprotein translocase subunit SecG [Kiritimatiellia bacterium]MDD4118736.1 preprotein translocase subunit SecG [Kiritimatiellia bacterium]HPC58477.1 preprotein translocase subunit SecG [Kiritimatiellia bacterium]
MSILISVLLIVEVLAAFLLIVVILAQKSKDQGLGMAFGGGMGESLFGSRAGNVLTRMTVTLAVVFMVTTILLGILFARGSTGGGSVMDRADRQLPAAPALPAQAAPQMPADLPEAGELPMAVSTEAPSAPVVMQMGEGGELAPVAAEAAPEPAVEETAPAAEEAE